MRKNAIIRIILWSVLLLVLVGILVTALLWHRNGSPIRWMKSDRIETGTETSSREFEADGIRNLEIYWASGDITIIPDDSTDTIRIIEESSNNDYPMVCKLSGGTLILEYTDKDVTVSIFGGVTVNGPLRKDLTILVPSDWVCNELEIDAASTDLQITDLTLHSVVLNGASGDCELRNCSVIDMEINTASGDVRFDGELKTLEFDAASASFIGNLKNVPSRIEMDSASGDLELTLPADAGFTVSVDGISTGFSSDFPTQTVNDRYVCGDGSCLIEVDGVSGNVIINKAQ